MATTTAARARKYIRKQVGARAPLRRRHRRPAIEPEDVLIGVGAGVLGGLLGSLAMNYAHRLFDTGKEMLDHQLGWDEPTLFDSAVAGPRKEEQEEEPATAKAAGAVAHAAGYELDEEEKRVGGQIMHYGFGVAMGALYGGAAAAMPVITRGHGTAAGALLWLIADEAAVPALGLSKPPQKFPASVHVKALWNHLVFGMVVETFRVLALRALGRKP